MRPLRPMTERERLTWWINMQAAGARVYLDSMPEIRPSTRWMHDNTAGSACYGKPNHYHVHHHTNHAQPINGEIEQ